MFLFSHKRAPTVPEVTGLQIQTAVNVLPIPIIYGCPRAPINVIYANGFRAVAQKSGGKGLLTGGKGQTTGYTYYATFLAAVCEGVAGVPLGIFDDQMTYSPGSIPHGRDMTWFPGTTTQVAPGAITAPWPNDAFDYIDTAYMLCNDFVLDASATIPQLNFIPEGKFAASCPLNAYSSPDGYIAGFPMDADPAQCVFDFLTNSTYGVGFPVSLIDQSTLFTSTDGFNSAIGDAALSTYCQAVGFGWSLVLNNAEPASSILERWMKNLVVATVWTGATLKFIPYWDLYCAANPGYYTGTSTIGGNPSGYTPPGLKYYSPTANITVLFDLTDDDFIQTGQGDDPLVVTRSDVADVMNTVRLNFRDRNNQFNDNVSEAKDENYVEAFGPRVDRMGTADEFTFPAYPSMSVQIQLQRNVAVRNTYEFKLSWLYCILDPMDVVTLTDTTLGLNKQPVRIVSLEEDEKGILTVKAEEFPQGIANATAFTRQANTPPTFVETNVAPAAVNAPLIFEPTSQMLASEGEVQPTIAIAVSGGPSGAFDPNWGGANVWVSNDNVTYQQMNPPAATGASRMGVTTASLAAYTGGNPDNTNTLSVDLSESQATLDNFTDAQAALGLSLCAVLDGNGCLELLAYTTATLTGPNTYDLTGLYRGLYGTVADLHGSGALFTFVDARVYQAVLPNNFIGIELFIKLQSFNIYGLAQQDIATCAVYTYIPTGQGSGTANNQLAIALESGQDIDLNTFVPDGIDLDLGSGGGACDPSVLNVDLETF